MKNLMLTILLIAALSACGSSRKGGGDLSFDMHHMEVGHQTASVIIFDQNADGHLDLATTGGGSLSVLRGDGAGNFEVFETVSAGEHPVDLKSGDLNNDGWPDLVIVNHETTYLTLLFGGSAGFNTGRNEQLMIDVSPHPHAVAVVDLNGDENQDIIVDDRDRERLRVYSGDGRGSFQPGPPIHVGDDPYRLITFDDLNEDGHPDVITPNPRSIAIQFGNGKGAFVSSTKIESASLLPFSTSVADFNGDRIPDIAAGSGEGPGLLMVWHGTGNGGFEAAPNTPLDIAKGPTRINHADINNDEIDDILVTSYLGNEMSIVMCGKEDFQVVRIPLNDNPWDIAAGDLNEDGRQDLVVARDNATEITVLIARDN